MSLSNHVAELKLQFRQPLLVEGQGDLSHMESDRCEIVDVYTCQHRGGTWTIAHVPHGGLPFPATAAEPVCYGDFE